MWLLTANGLVYLALNLVAGRLRRRFWPLRARAIVADLAAALRGRLAHDDLGQYNAVQKLAYLGAIGLLVLAVLSGLAVWKSVQLPLLRELMGGFDNARVVHFFAMSGLVRLLRGPRGHGRAGAQDLPVDDARALARGRWRTDMKTSAPAPMASTALISARPARTAEGRARAADAAGAAPVLRSAA